MFGVRGRVSVGAWESGQWHDKKSFAERITALRNRIIINPSQEKAATGFKNKKIVMRFLLSKVKRNAIMELPHHFNNQ